MYRDVCIELSLVTDSIEHVHPDCHNVTERGVPELKRNVDYSTLT